MKVVNTNHTINGYDLNNSLFLAGPSPRGKRVSWRRSALEILKTMNYDGIVFVPEFSEDYYGEFDFNVQVEWEHFCLENCGLIVFWVPRCLETLPGFTTNVEFGRFVTCEKYNVIYGRPDRAPHTNYLDWLYKKFSRGEPFNDLKNLLNHGVNHCLKKK